MDGWGSVAEIWERKLLNLLELRGLYRNSQERLDVEGKREGDGDPVVWSGVTMEAQWRLHFNSIAFPVHIKSNFILCLK